MDRREQHLILSDHPYRSSARPRWRDVALARWREPPRTQDPSGMGGRARKFSADR
jgi:hypothetical protein